MDKVAQSLKTRRHGRGPVAETVSSGLIKPESGDVSPRTPAKDITTRAGAASAWIATAIGTSASPLRPNTLLTITMKPRIGPAVSED